MFKPLEEYKLCYVEDNFAYFTSKDLSEQWGDGWGKKPYEHNAGIPYGACEKASTPKKNIDSKRSKNARIIREFKTEQGYEWVEFSEFDENGVPFWDIVKIAFEGSFDQPKDYHYNSQYSVEDINKGNIAWLLSYDKSVGIFAGGSILDFIKKINLVNGVCYLTPEMTKEITKVLTPTK